MNIKGEKITLRALEPSDLDVMYGWENDTALWGVSGTIAPFSRHVLSRLIDEQQFDIYATRQMRLVVENNEGQAVGAVDLFEFDPHNRRAGVGIVIGRDFRRRGYARDSLLTLDRYVCDVLRLRQLWCSVTDDNRASLALFSGVGYRECGRRREWILSSDGARDEVLMQKIF